MLADGGISAGEGGHGSKRLPTGRAAAWERHLTDWSYQPTGSSFPAAALVR